MSMQNNSGSSGGVYEAGITETPTRNCFAVLVNNEPGVLARVVGLFSGRGYNIESLTVDEVDRGSHLSRITIVTTGSPMVINQIKAQLGRLIPVRKVVNLTEQGRFVEACVGYVKLVAEINKHEDAKMVARKLGARIVDTTNHAIIFELTAATEKIDQLGRELGKLGTIEVARTGSVAISCGEDVLALPPIAERKSA